MTVAVIDCGTNTFHLIIAQTQTNGFEILYKKNIAVKLGEGGIGNHIITPVAFERGLIALKEFSAAIKDYHATFTLAYATEAIRRAGNGVDFIEQALLQTGIKLQTIDGNLEAELIYLGVKEAVPLDNEYVVIMDIGGGSTELIIANYQNIHYKQSFPLGAALLLDRFKPSDPIKPEEVESIHQHIAITLKPFIEQIQTLPSVHTLIGSSGSFDTFLAMAAHQFTGYQHLHATCNQLSLNHYSFIHQQLISSTIQQRQQMPGIIPMRVDMIVMASLLLNFVIHNSPMNKLLVSAYALKEGMLYFAMNNRLS
jgi:exopolyphosphatase/guanosine-5'-triphosphate,3'-diphosphate pyrophosphatase